MARAVLVALSDLPHCDSDGARALFDRELARADVVPMHRMQRVWPSGASVGRPTRASSQRRRRRPHVARNRLCADRGGRRCRACNGDTITAARDHGALVARGLRVNRGCAYARCVLPAGEDAARVADVAGVERLVPPGGRGSARCSSARRTRAVSGSDCGSGASGAGRGPRRRPRLRGSRTAATSGPARALSGHGGGAHSQVSARLPRTDGTPGNRSGTPGRPLAQGADRDPFLDRLLADVLVARIAVEFAQPRSLSPGGSTS